MSGALPVPGERYKRDGLVREVLKVRPAHDHERPNLGFGDVTYRIRFGDHEETRKVGPWSWSKWAEKARKEGAQ